MILCDANLLLYAYNRAADQHRAAKAWLETHIGGPDLFALAWATVLAFVRICTNSRAVRSPLKTAEACAIVSEWLELPSVVILQPGEAHWTILSDVLVRAKVHGPLVSDAHLAALAIEHGAILHSTDHDFSRFADLQWIDPLQANP